MIFHSIALLFLTKLAMNKLIRLILITNCIDFQKVQQTCWKKLGLSKYFPNKIDFIDAISLPIQTSNQLNVHSLAKMVLNDIMMVNRVARDQNLLNYLKCLQNTNKQNDYDNEDSDDEDDADDDDENEVKVDINPLDMLVAIFYCSSYTLQQVIADKLFSCCIAIPFVFPPNDSFHKTISTYFTGQPPSTMMNRIHNLQFDALFVDENCFNVRERKDASLVLLELPQGFIDFKKTCLPLQTTILPDISDNFRKMYSACNIIALKQNDIRQELLQLREKQLQTMGNLHPFMITLISKLLQYEDRLEQVNIFALCLKSYLDERCRDNIQLQKYECKDVFSDERRLNNRRTDLVFGFEHLMREVAQIFESCSALKSQCEENTLTLVSKFPAFAAQFLLKGQPVEVMDGDTGYVPLEWIKAIIKELVEELHDKKCMVLSVIGIQSTGKSTLLNTMFGLTFPVSAGRCTKGVFMQIIPVSRDDFQYILVLDTEGLRAPTKGIDMNTIDNEIATFAVGLSDITIVNIKGESTSEMKEVMSMAICSLLRLKLGNQNININQTCLFVHQNVSDENAHEMTEQERHILTSELDSMTYLWSKVGNIKHISSGYSESVAELKGKIMNLASFERYLPFSNLIMRVDDIWTGILGDSFVFDFSSSLSLKAYDEMIKQFQELKWNLHRIGENELNHAENLLFATNENYNEFVERIQSQLDESMEFEKKNICQLFMNL
ncbi:unnamed protein product [Mytilus edulis]|uniref:VLIG-type G domain-containing protein n=1 Tax=Mytilus edulis TaxID=6550 RepID=A0A8S3UWF1_MYTED|nr:unnamed protein product [Mytilus edulis]